MTLPGRKLRLPGYLLYHFYFGGPPAAAKVLRGGSRRRRWRKRPGPTGPLAVCMPTGYRLHMKRTCRGTETAFQRVSCSYVVSSGSLRGMCFLDDFAVEEMDGALGVIGITRVVSHHADSGAAGVYLLE